MGFVVLCNPENRRLAFFQAALAKAGLAPAKVVSWLDQLLGRASLADAVRPGHVVRIESPGESFLVERELLALGAEVPDQEEPDATRIDAAAARRLEDDPGRILYPRQWFLGFREALARLAPALEGAHVLNDPDDIVQQFDKRKCHTMCEQARIPVPRALGRVRSAQVPLPADELRARLREGGPKRVFVKLASSSSASGSVALETQGERGLAHTTVELVRERGALRFYNSLRVRRYTDRAEIGEILDAILREGAQVEEWLPKASIGGRAFDLRIVVVAGRARQVVVRTSRSPFTNLHLGNARGDPDAVRAKLGDEGWARALATAERAAALFPRSLYSGVDLLVRSTLRGFAILELNAFGDLLPNVLHEGQDTYESEVHEALAARALS